MKAASLHFLPLAVSCNSWMLLPVAGALAVGLALALTLVLTADLAAVFGATAGAAFVGEGRVFFSEQA